MMLSAIDKKKLEFALFQQSPAYKAYLPWPWGLCLKDGHLLEALVLEGIGSISVPISSQVN